MTIDENHEFFSKLTNDLKKDLIESYELLISISGNGNSKLFWQPILEILLYNKVNKNIIFSDQVSVIRKEANEYFKFSFSEIMKLFNFDDFVLKCKFIAQKRKNFLKNRSFLGIGKNINEKILF